MLFLDFQSVIQTISSETLLYVPPGAGKLFDLEPVWEYFSVLIPYATYPILWLVIYLAVLYAVFRRSLSHIVLPLCLFTALYTYPMAKGYIVIFARQVTLLLPIQRWTCNSIVWIGKAGFISPISSWLKG